MTQAECNKLWDRYFKLRFAPGDFEVPLTGISFNPDPTFGEYCAEFLEDPEDPMAKARHGALCNNMRENKNIRLYEEAYRLAHAKKASDEIRTSRT